MVHGVPASNRISPLDARILVVFTILNFLQGFRERKEVFPLTVVRKQIRIRVF